MKKVDFTIKIADAFLTELHDKGNTWRMLRNDTLIDMINLNFRPNQNYTFETLVDIINLGFKFKLNNALGVIEIPSLSFVARIPFDRDIPELEDHYHSMLTDAVRQSEKFTEKGFDALNREFINLRIISELDIKNYTLDYLDTIIGICMNILHYSIYK